MVRAVESVSKVQCAMFCRSTALMIHQHLCQCLHQKYLLAKLMARNNKSQSNNSQRSNDGNNSLNRLQSKKRGEEKCMSLRSLLCHQRYVTVLLFVLLSACD